MRSQLMAYIPKLGDKITLTDDQLEDQRASVKVIKAIATQGYLTVSEVFEYLPGQYIVCVTEDPKENVGFLNFKPFK